MKVNTSHVVPSSCTRGAFADLHRRQISDTTTALLVAARVRVARPAAVAKIPSAALVCALYSLSAGHAVIMR